MAELRLNYLEKGHIVIDVGLTYTKIGFVKESMPLHIIQTPLSMVQQLHNSNEAQIFTYQSQSLNQKGIRENLSKLAADSFVNIFRHDEDRLENEIEEFMSTLFFHVIKTAPKEKSIVLCERLGGMRKLNETIAKVLFERFKIKSIYCLLSNVLPLYATGLETGIVVDCGFQQVEVLPLAYS